MLTVCDRDGKTPEEITKQILSIAPILPGQKPNESFEIPQKAPIQSKPTVSTPTAPNDNLIDFDEPAPQSREKIQAPVDQPSYGLAGASLQKPLQPSRGASTAPSGNSTVPEPHRGNPIQRFDSNSHEVDAFFDAEA